MRPEADRAGLYGRVVSGAAGIPVITAQETRAAPPRREEAGGAGRITVKCPHREGLSRPASEHDAGTLFKEDDGSGAGLFW